ncbi:hypothetical protein B0J18DRAFT_406484 [Chaetomium sp. MPI-SDFR-AT-0129]|nr:hypothetical protein B0J18DRAFT_406484 [Chaetomium sp. MPI-SDFR-AT-0129]
MANREFWEAVKHEVRDMLAPEHARGVEVGRRTLDENLPTEVLDPNTALPTVIQNTRKPQTALPTTDALNVAPTSDRTSTSSTSHVSTHTTPTLTPSATATGDASGGEASGGMSTAAMAGIIIGALGGILIVFVFVYLVFGNRKKKLARQRQQMEDDEKIHGPFTDNAEIQPAPRTPNKAPRLSLRPVTQFLPNFNNQNPERRQSRGIALALNPVFNPPQNRANDSAGANGGGSAWERPAASRAAAAASSSSGSQSKKANPKRPGLHVNPFHDNHRLPDEPVSPISSMGSFDNRVGVAQTSEPIPEPVSPILDNDDEGGANARQLPATTSNITRKASIRKDLPKPLDLTKPPSPLYAVPPSPSGTEYSVHSMAPGQAPAPSASAAAIAAAGGPSSSTVHRVQLDFKPTLPDEMVLFAGQLVRLLHEYDDGWALCIRLDRSQQGVVPRTCLSTRPVKPRPPQGANNGGNPRGGPPINPSFHHQNGNGNGHGGNPGRPRSPGGFPAVPNSRDGNGRQPGGLGSAGPSSSHHPQGGWRDDAGSGGDGDVSPAVGQAY